MEKMNFDDENSSSLSSSSEKKENDTSSASDTLKSTITASDVQKSNNDNITDKKTNSISASTSTSTDTSDIKKNESTNSSDVKKDDDTIKVGSLYNMVNNKNSENSSSQKSSLSDNGGSAKSFSTGERAADLTAKEIENRINSRVNSAKYNKSESPYGRNLKEIIPKDTDETSSTRSTFDSSTTTRKPLSSSSQGVGTNNSTSSNTSSLNTTPRQSTSSLNSTLRQGTSSTITKPRQTTSGLNATSRQTTSGLNTAPRQSASGLNETSRQTTNANNSRYSNNRDYDDYNDNSYDDNYDDSYDDNSYDEKSYAKGGLSKAKIAMISVASALILSFAVWLFAFDGKSILFTSKATVEKNKQEVKEAFTSYFDHLNKKEYEDMYGMIDDESKQKIDENSFVLRNKKIYSGMGVNEVKSEVNGDVETDKKKKEYTVKYTQSMTTIVGDIKFDNSAVFTKVEADGNEHWVMRWDHDKIHPNLKSNYKVNVDTESYTPKRGAILDRNGEKLAYTDENGKRNYPQGELFCHAVGIVKYPTAEDLKELDPNIYDEHSLVGVKGLEYAFEDKLRGIKGGKIAINDESGKEVSVIAESEMKNGEDIKTTLDLKYQKAAYEGLKDRSGVFTCMDPSTGEVLALISTPTYNPNTGGSNYNKFAVAYCPGSSFKPINAGIGLTGGFYDENTTVEYDGDTYTRAGWGDYRLKTTSDYGGTSDHKLVNALTMSDNIYFGLMAVDHIKRSNFMKGLDNLGFGEIFPFEIKPQKASQYCNDKETALNSDALLADTGFGQGQLLINPIHMMSIYSTFVADGSMIQPYLEYKEKPERKYYKENVFSKDAVSKINEGLKSVVQRGTATAAKSAKVSVAGKTGTAELKGSRGESGQENGWFCGYTYDNDKPIVFVTFSEAVPNHSLIVERATKIINGCY